MAIDFSKLGTKTKYFRGDDSIDFLFPYNNVSQIPVFVKKFFIEGFDETAITSATCAAGVLTVATGVAFKGKSHKVVAVTGFTNPALNKEYRIMEAPDTQTFRLYAPDIPDGTYTGSPKIKFAPLGWDLVAETSTAIAIRSKVVPFNRYTLIFDWSYKSVATASFVSSFMGVSDNFVNFSTPYKNYLEVPNTSKRSQAQWCYSAYTYDSNDTRSLDPYTITHARWEIMKPTYWLCGDDKMFYIGLNPDATTRVSNAPPAFYAFGGFKPYNTNEVHPIIFQGNRWSSDTNNSQVDGTSAATQWYSPRWWSLSMPCLTSVTYPNNAQVISAWAAGQANGAGFAGGACFLRPYAGLGGAPASLSTTVMGAVDGLVSGGSLGWETTFFRSPNIHLGGVPLLEPQFADISGFRGMPYGLKFVPCFFGDLIETSGYSSVTKVIETANANIVDLDEAEAYVIGLVNNNLTTGYGAVAFPLKDWV
ncbi:MAG: hypothetical protein RR280_01390 [Bacteroidaceae bacterium]